MTEQQWAGLTDFERKKRKLWTRREWASVDDRLRGTTAATAKLAVAKTFGGLPARTAPDVRCYRITNKAGQVVAFSLRYCSNGLRQDL